MIAITRESWHPGAGHTVGRVGERPAEGLLPRIPTECALLRRLAARRGLQLDGLGDSRSPGGLVLRAISSACWIDEVVHLHDVPAFGVL